jgi:hypothetical protein
MSQVPYNLPPLRVRFKNGSGEISDAEIALMEALLPHIMALMQEEIVDQSTSAVQESEKIS